jgi:carboxypeptidase Taq
VPTTLWIVSIMSNSPERLYETLSDYVRQSALLGSIESLLAWDERTMLPAAGAEHRAEQMKLLAGMIHQRWTDPRLGEWLGELAETALAEDPFSDTGATLRRIKRQYEKRVKLPQSLVEELTRVSVLGQQAWQEARAQSDFPAFQPWLEQILELKRQEAEALGYPDCRYDALLDEYEPDERTSNVARVLGQLREQLVPLVEQIRGSGRRPDVSILQRHFPAAEQESFGREAAGGIGFDLHRGRLDVTAHPFCCTVGPRDCRITTRYDENAFAQAFFGILHEAGHGIYEQGLREDQFGLPLGEAASLGIHESQSRLWENLVGRSRAFWEHFFGKARERFPQALGDVSPDEFYFAVNDVRPSLVRVEADEATYNLHILIRFELEQALLDEDLSVSDLPGAWNEQYGRSLGVTPANDAEGVLQDIHWSGGMIGYFPTYSLGNLYAAQLFASAEADLGGLAEQFARGEFQPLLEWLREKVHRQGQRYPAAELVERITGQPLSHGPLIEHLRAKLEPLYGLA